MKKLIALMLAAMMAFAIVPTFAEGEKKEAGFEEYPIGEEQDVNILHVSCVYFQPVQMEPLGENGLSPEESNIHIEADISALEIPEDSDKFLGFGPGAWVPYLTVDYSIVNQDTNAVAAEGTFMPMAASDGPHYGANIKLPDAGTYTVTLTIHSPIENGYLLHVDAETGVKGRFWTEPLVVKFTNWKYVPQEW